MNNTGSRVETRYRELKPHGHWFDVSTLKFFNSSVEYEEELPNGSWVFITKESEHEDKLGKYTIREMDTKGSISNVSGFQEFNDLDDAIAWLEDE